MEVFCAAFLCLQFVVVIFCQKEMGAKAFFVLQSFSVFTSLCQKIP